MTRFVQLSCTICPTSELFSGSYAIVEALDCSHLVDVVEHAP
jgi:hypothetical protein